jgi:biopolymer transport protein ExbB/TolQ
MEFLKHNFFHVAPILLVGGIATAITFERLRALQWAFPLGNSQKFFEKLRDLVMADRLAEAIAFCDRDQGKLVPGVVREALLRAHQPEAMIHDALDLAVSEAMMKASKRTAFLSMIANVATLLGLFGTIIGLIQSFEAVGSATAQERSALLAQGISTAMNATMLGLAVAIPSMIAFSYLMNRTNRLTMEIDQSAVRIMDLIKQRYYAAEIDSSGKANGVSRIV